MEYTFRNVLAFIGAGIFYLTGHLKTVRKSIVNRKIILSVCSHNPDKKLFEDCIRWLKKKGFSFISINDLSAIASGEKAFPTGAVLITIDDGWRSNKENIVAIANKYRIPVTLFITTEPVATGNAYWWSYINKAHRSGITRQSVPVLKKVKDEARMQIVEAVKARLHLQREALTIEELKEIKGSRYISIGSHSVTHPILTNCSEEKAKFEIGESRKILERWVDQKITSFAYPNGNYTTREIELLKEAGYQMAFTTDENYLTPENITQLYTLPRIEIVESFSFTENICRITGIWFKKRAQFNFLRPMET
jgi:poly-beta-1,6-N-acetyl-D-glucosamine N-deacetylase